MDMLFQFTKFSSILEHDIDFCINSIYSGYFNFLDVILALIIMF
jgi:hypothetical protein